MRSLRWKIIRSIKLYDISALFAGESDDILFLHLVKLMRESYGEKLSLENLLKDEAAWENFSSACRDLPKAKLDSRVREEEDSSNEELGFRFMGQRYALDQEIFSKLIWSKVKENREGVQRSLPKVLDVAAVFGSPVADTLLEEAGDFEFKNFTENLQDLKDKFGKSTGNADNFAAAWLDLLRPLLADKSETSGYYPSFMRGDKWAKRNLECFAGSYTELKHDTILYSKQVMAEMGGMFRDKIDDRGYVQPEPEVYRALAKLNRRTLDTLENATVIDEKSFEPINLYIDLCERLAEISEIELAGELPSDDDFEFIRAFGGNISHIDFLLTNWEEVGALGAEKLPDEIVADIASNPESNQCLEVAIGKPQNIWVIVPVDGSLRLAVGLVYDFYEFPVSFEQRMTDEDWTSIYMQKVLGHEPFGNETVEVDLSIEPLKPSWTEEYRYDPEKEGEQAPKLNTLPNWVALFSAERMSSDGSFVASLNQGKLKLEDKEGMQISIPSYISFVQDAHFLDLDQDGSEELMLLCWKYGRFSNLRPFG